MTLGFIADLHNHTTASDGEYMPTELVNHAASLGLQAVGVTDHDTLCLLYTSPSPRDRTRSRMPSSA